MASPVVLIPKYAKLGEGFTRSEQAEAHYHPGRRTDGTQSAASWLSDLAGLRKMILLCAWCRNKFNPRKNGYRRLFTPDQSGASDGYTANGVCDACKQMTALSPGGGTAYVADEYHSAVTQDPIEARRKARLRWR